jgi:hypothetical protein
LSGRRLSGDGRRKGHNGGEEVAERDHVCGSRKLGERFLMSEVRSDDCR